MKRTSILRKALAVIFGIAVVTIVSVREVHYLFSQSHIHEHCENHLHGAEEHNHCAACKFDISLFTDEVPQPPVLTAVSYHSTPIVVYQSVILYSTVRANTLRGPPVAA